MASCSIREVKALVIGAVKAGIVSFVRLKRRTEPAPMVSEVPPFSSPVVPLSPIWSVLLAPITRFGLAVEFPTSLATPFTPRKRRVPTPLN